MSESGNYNYQPHLKFFGLSYNPFPSAPDNTDFYISLQSDKIITDLTRAIVSRKGFMVLTGEIGLGKTTLSRRIIQTLEKHEVETSLILQSFFQGENLLRAIITDFGIETETEIEIEAGQKGLSRLMTLLNNFLLEKNKAGINCAILIDDAQNLTIESLELVRMISNLETDREKLVQILLIGQSELMEKLDSHELRQLKSRITAQQEPIPLTQSELEKYIQFKLNSAGDSGKITIKKNAIKKLFKKSGGNFRRINMIMDQALYLAFSSKTYIIKTRFIDQADKELILDIPKKKSPGYFSSFIIFTLILIIIGMVGGSVVFYFYLNKKEPAAAKQDVIVSKPVPAALKPVPTNEQPSPIAGISEEHSSIDTAPDNKSSEIKPAGSESVKSFLRAYGLESFAVEFNKNLEQNSMNSIRSTIFDQSGYQLIVLSSIPNHIKETYTILSRTGRGAENPEFYLFWKPWLKVVKFYSGYRGEEIKTLQKLLTDALLYDFGIDGIVGNITMERILEFQNLNHLPVTGFPDPETIFLLANPKKNRSW